MQKVRQASALRMCVLVNFFESGTFAEIGAEGLCCVQGIGTGIRRLKWNFRLGNWKMSNRVFRLGFRLQMQFACLYLEDSLGFGEFGGLELPLLHPPHFGDLGSLWFRLRNWDHPITSLVDF